jgi:hypothetical protein
MFAVGFAGMAVSTEPLHRFYEQRGVVRCMWCMANSTLPLFNGSMYGIIRKGGFVMAVIAELRRFLSQEFRKFARMGIMALGAAFAEGRMHDLTLKFGLVMAAKAQFRRC